MDGFTAFQVRNLLRRLAAATCGVRSAPLVVVDAGYRAAALTAAMAGQPVHLLIRLPAGSVFSYDPATWLAKTDSQGTRGAQVTCRNADDADQSNPKPDESLILPGTALYAPVAADAWRGVHPEVRCDRGWFAGWQGKPPVLRGTLLRVTVDHLPDGRALHRAKWLWLWHTGPVSLSPGELWRAYLARIDEEHAFNFVKSTLGLTAAKVRTPSYPAR